MIQGPRRSRVPQLSLAAALCAVARLPAQQPAAAPAVETLSSPLHDSGGVVEESPDASKKLRAADAAIASEDWAEAAALLDAVMGPAERAGEPRVRSEDPILVTADRIVYTPAAAEARRRVAKLTGAGLEAWRARRGAEPEAPAAPRAPAGDAVPAAAGAADAPEARPGSYARWAHRLTNYRKLESSRPARNFYYVYFPMQAVTWKDLIFIRSHQDIVALAAGSGDIRWRHDSTLPVAEQSHRPSGSSGFDSFRIFTDLGGWAITVVPGEPDRIVALSRPARGVVTGNTLSFPWSQLLAFEAATGAPSWKRGGPEDPSEALRALSFAAPPTETHSRKGRTIAAPAVSAKGYHVVGLTPAGDLSWAVKIYSFAGDRLQITASSLVHGASLAASGGVLVGAPGHGIVFALGGDGDVLWERRYTSSIRENPFDPRWAPGHPIIAGGKAIAAPFDGESLMAVDLETGALAWEENHPAGYHSLLGADAEHAYRMDMDGRVTALSTGGGAMAWTSEALGAPAGRGFVTSTRIYASLDRYVVVLDSSSGKVISRSRVWDDRIEAPVPGNLFPVRGGLLAMGPWGIASIEPHEESWKGLDSLGLRERRLRESRLCRVERKYEESLRILREVVASTGDPAEVSKLRSELIESAQEASLETRDAGFIRKVLGDPDLVPTPEQRIAVLLRSADILRESAPEEAGWLYEELSRLPEDAVTETPEGMVADVRAYASDCLRELVARGSARVSDEAEEGAGDEVAKAEGSEARLLYLARRPHLLAAARAEALLSSMAAEAGDPAASANHLARMLDDFPAFGTPEVRARLEELRREAAPPAPSPPDAGLLTEREWKKRFEGTAPGTELFGQAEGSDPLPGPLYLDSSGAVLLDGEGRTRKRIRIEGLPALDRMAARISSVLLEPAVAHVRGDRVLLFTAAGIHEALDLLEGEPRVRAWHSLEHPLLPLLGAGGAAHTREAQPAPAKKKASYNDNVNLYPRLEFSADGSPAIIETNGTLTLLDRATGRIRHKLVARGKPAGAPKLAGRLAAVESADPRGVALDDLATQHRSIIPMPATPWRVELVPGIAAVVETQDGIQVRELLDPFPTLWRDRTPRGIPSLAFADAVQVVAAERGGTLASRSLRSGRLRWSVPFPASASPMRAIRAHSKGGAEDIIIASSRNIDPEDGRGVLGTRVPQDLFFTRVGLDGTKRWETQAVKGAVAFEPTRWVQPDGRWILLWNDKRDAWRTRAVVLDPEDGRTHVLFDHPLEDRPNQPPPRWCVTLGGIATGTLGGWAFYAADP